MGQSHAMDNFLAFMSFLVFLLLAASMASPYWLHADQDIILPPNIAAIVGVTNAGNVQQDMGMLWACTETDIALTNDKNHECESLADIDSDMVKDWQWTAAGMGVATLVAVFLAMVVSCWVACRGSRSTGQTALVTMFYLIACGLYTACVVMFHENREYSYSIPDFSLTIEYELSWAFYVAAVGAGSFLLMAVFNLATICCSRSGTHA